MAKKNGKIVVVGDGACGKTCLLEVFRSDTFPEEYVPTVVDNFGKTVKIDDNEVSLVLWDTAGQEDYDTIRPLSYRGTDLVFLCYTVENKKNLENISNKWLVEIKNYCPTAAYYLIALKKDMRDESKDKAGFITEEDGKKVAEQIKADKFYECSALTRENVDKIFKEGAKFILENETNNEEQSNCCEYLFCRRSG